MHAVVPDVVLNFDYSGTALGNRFFEIEDANLADIVTLRTQVTDQNVSARGIPSKLMRIFEMVRAEALRRFQIVDIETVDIVSDGSEESLVIGIPQMMCIGPQPVSAFFEVHRILACHDPHPGSLTDIEQEDLLAEIPQQRQFSVRR